MRLELVTLKNFCIGIELIELEFFPKFPFHFHLYHYFILPSTLYYLGTSIIIITLRFIAVLTLCANGPPSSTVLYCTVLYQTCNCSFLTNAMLWVPPGDEFERNRILKLKTIEQGGALVQIHALLCWSVGPSTEYFNYQKALEIWVIETPGDRIWWLTRVHFFSYKNLVYKKRGSDLQIFKNNIANYM